LEAEDLPFEDGSFDEDLPFEDGSFDVVLSIFGVMLGRDTAIPRFRSWYTEAVATGRQRYHGMSPRTTDREDSYVPELPADRYG
jgi:hypothetical protein